MITLMEVDMPTMDVFSKTDQLEDTILDVMVERLETRGSHPRFVAMMDEYLDAMAIDKAGDVLDMGCGTGVVARAIAKRPKFSGRVIGIDLSAYLAEAAARLSSEEGLAERVRFQTGDTQSLGFEDGAFDAVVAHTLMSHVPDPGAVLGEAARLVRPGGAIGVFDGDFTSLSFELENAEDAAQFDARLVESVSNQPRVMRRLPRLAREAGLRIEQSFAYVLTEVGRAEFWESSVRSLGALLPKAGAMSQEEADAWVASQMRASEEGVFFGTSNYYGYVLRRP
jgi:ubiquinone/menaquinone biosynthesis C-methylase UbiE